ncbi:MAG: PilX N-terminal domain-containing pilus assembly protein [Thiohalocapsa sp.]
MGPKGRQNGVALIVSLLILMVTTIIGVNAMHMHYLEEQMAGNFRHHNLAFQAAETALRDGEQDIASTNPRFTGLTSFNSTCTNGLCDATGGLSDVWLDATKEANGVVLGTYTGRPALASVSQQPKYWIEAFRVRPTGNAAWKTMYRVTAIGWGGDANTEVLVQSVFTLR